MALGISGMDENFGVNSLQPSMKCKFAATIPGDAPMQLLDSSGNVLVEFQIDEPDKKYNSVVISCPELTVGKTYTLTAGSTSAGARSGWRVAASAKGGNGSRQIVAWLQNCHKNLCQTLACRPRCAKVIWLL